MSRTALRRLLVTATTLALYTTALSLPAAQAQTFPGPGAVHAWGDNEYGETQVPASLTGKDVVAVSAGYEHTLALTSDGKVTAWGYNDYGQATVPSSLDDQRVTDVEAGNRISYALTSEGKLVAWGYGWVPPSLDGKEVTAVTTDGPTAALASDGHVTMWSGQQEYPVPSAVANETFTDVDTSMYPFFGVTTAGKVMTWDLFGRPQTPVPDALTDKVVTKVAASTGTAMALTAAGQVIAWDFTSIYVPFQPHTGQSVVPADLADKRVVDIAAGQYHSLALTSDGRVHAWGQNIAGATDVPAGLGPVTTIAASWYGSLAVTHDPLDVTGTPVVTGTPKVGQTLTTDTTGVSSTPTSTPSGQWLRDGVAIPDATGATYELTNADAGAMLIYRTVLAAPGYADVPVDSNGLGPVTGGHIALPAPVVTGTPVVGQPLTVSLPTSGAALSPADAQVTFTWRRDATVLGTGRTYTPTADDAGHTLHATATATRANFDDATATIETGTVTPAPPHSTTPAPETAPAAAPVVTLHATRTALRRGQTTTLTWTVDNAEQARASGSWSGRQPAHASGTVRPTTLGKHTYRLTATNTHGTTTAQVTINVTRQAKRLILHAPTGIQLAGTRVPLTGHGLDPGEAYTLKLGRTTVATGKATSAGSFTRAVTLPTSTHQGRHSITVVGSEKDRTGSTPAHVVTKRGMIVHLAKHDVRASDQQTVTVTGLAAGEPVTVTYQGKRISSRSAHATTTGRYRITFKVDTVWGAKTVTTVGGFASRRDTDTFQVVRRCASTSACA